MAQLAQNDRVVLTFKLGINSSTGVRQWQARDGGVLYVPHYHGHMPTANHEQWECRRLEQIGGAGRRSCGVVVVWLVCRYVSPAQQRTQVQEAPHPQFADA